MTAVSYGYDEADRLTSTGVTSPQLGAAPLAITGLTPALLHHDMHGNTTVFADQTMVYGIADRHMKTTLSDGTTMTYARDATGGIAAHHRRAQHGENDSSVRYAVGGMVLSGSGRSFNGLCRCRGVCRWH